MRRFIRHNIYFMTPLLLLFILGSLLPATPRASKSLLFANKGKDQLLSDTSSPRIIFVGGSNLSFGLNSQLIKDSTRLNPINTGVHSSIGLQYMLKNTLQYVKSGDIVVLAPEYHHFYMDYNAGSPELLRTILEVNPSKLKLLNILQLLELLPHIPKYALSKLKPTEYVRAIEDAFYSVYAFNQFGDADTHWGYGKKPFRPYDRIKGTFNPSVIEGIKDFQKHILDKNALLLVSFPGFQSASYQNCADRIKRVETEFVKNGFRVLGSPERYLFTDSMMFDTPYHLNKTGVDFRTILFVDDLNKYAARHRNANGLEVACNNRRHTRNRH